MKKISMNEKGITLIALVITIVVLLILAGISIGSLFGHNGIVNQAKDASNETVISSEKEQLQIATINASGKSINGIYDYSDLQDELDKLTGRGKTDVTGEDIFTVTFNDSKNIYYVTEDGNVLENTNPSIFTYNDDGYITGVKEEYWDWIKELEQGKVVSKIKVASNDKIKIAAIKPPEGRLLKAEVGTTLIIPRKIENTEIKGISEGAFSAFFNLERIIFPNTIKEIDDGACYFCSMLKDVYLKNGLERIGESAFAFCDIKDIFIPDTTLEIGSKCFENCFYGENVGRIFIPKSVKVIGSEVFAGISYNNHIYCEIESKPEGWDENWTSKYYPDANVEWGASR